MNLCGDREAIDSTDTACQHHLTADCSFGQCNTFNLWVGRLYRLFIKNYCCFLKFEIS